MKIEEPIMGFAEYQSKQYPFIFENGILKLMPASIREWHEEKINLWSSMGEFANNIYSNNWVGYSKINAKSHDETNIIFCVSNDPSNNNGFISFSVIYFYKYITDEIDEKSIDGFFIAGREVNDFFSPARVLETQHVLDKDHKKVVSTNINVQRENEVILGKYKYQDTDITIKVSIIPNVNSRSNSPLSVQSKMEFTYSKSQNIDFTIEVFKHCMKFFFYICKRTNIKLGDIQVYKKKDSIYNNFGVIRMLSDYFEEELDIKRSQRIIKYDYIKEKVCLLFSEIADDKIYFENLCDSIQATKSFGIDRIILNFVAFEREFRNLYDEDIVRSEDYNQVKNEILEYLESIKEKNTGKKRKYTKSFISSLKKSENKYGDRMQKALMDCEEILLPFLKYNYKEYKTDIIEEICDRMNKLRNDSAHGNIDLQIEPINISDFTTLENLLYAMRLKNMDIKLINIRKAIKDLQNYNIMMIESE